MSKTPLTKRHVRTPRRAAFTLIELLIVVAIIAILAAIAVPNFLEAQTRAKVSRVLADFRNLATAVESYRTDNQDYPLYGIIPVTPGNTYQDPATIYGPADFEYLSRVPGLSLTTPVAYVTTIPGDPFGANFTGPKPMTNDYSYKNCKQNARNFAPGPYPAWLGFEGAVLIGDWGYWRLSSAGPDLTRIVDIKANIIYDPTNGTNSRGDLVRSQKRSGNEPK